MKAAEGLLWWYSGENVYQTNGSNIENISDPPGAQASKVRAVLDSVTEAYKHTAEAAVYPQLGWYVLSLPTDGSATPTVALVYDYRNRRWFGPFKHATLGAPTVFGDFLDAYEQPRVFCAFFGAMSIYDFIGSETELTDDGTAITAKWKSAGLDAGAPGFMHLMRRVSPQVTPIAASITARVYEDGSATAGTTRSGVSLNQARQLQRISLPGGRAFHSQVELEYSGEPQLVIKALHYEADVWGYEERPA
jgi:hypothetical protein